MIISMYAKGMSTRDINAHMRKIYGVDISADMVSSITDKILPVNVNQEGQIVKKTAYVILDR